MDRFSGSRSPGLLLVFVIGGSGLLSALAVLRHWGSEYLLSFGAGALLTGFIVVEMVMIE